MTEVSDRRTRPNAKAQSLGEAVQRMAQAFRAAGLETPDLDARVLAAEGAGVSRATVLAAPESSLDAEAQRRIAAMQERRLKREPVSRIIGRRDFRGLTLDISSATLDPRPETETIVDVAMHLVRQRVVPGGEAPRVLDLGTGTGAILIALLKELPQATGTGTDIEAEALKVARRNAVRHAVAARGNFFRSDWLTDVKGAFDLIVSNPPYIAGAMIDTLEPEVAVYDPRAALDGGSDGLAAYRAILDGVRRVLVPGGWLLLEIGAGDAERVLKLCRDGGLEPDEPRPWLHLDLAGQPRCVAVRTRR